MMNYFLFKHLIKVNIVATIASIIGFLINIKTPVIALLGTVAIYIVVNLATIIGYNKIKKEHSKQNI